MGDQTNNPKKGIDRRTVLKSAVAASAAGFVGVPAFSGSAVAQSLDETLYLSDTQDDPSQDPNGNDSIFDDPEDDTTKLYEVDIDSGNANLTEVFDFNNDISIDEDSDGVGDYNHVVAIAASPDGNTIYAIDKFTDRLGTYDVQNDSFTDVGVIGGPGTTLQAAVSPDGTLYITGFGDSGFYEVDTSTPSATKVATITDEDDNTLTAGGADFTFDAGGNLYFVDARSDPSALYKITDITDWSNTVTQVTTGSFGPGLAILDKGNGNLVYSDGENDDLVEIDTSGMEVDRYPLKEDGSDFDHQFGDLTVAELAGSTTFDLCAGQDTDVGTVTVADSPDAITITYNTTGGWELYETHVDIGDKFDDFPTTQSGNPKVGEFDLSGTHEGVTEVEYPVECGDAALDDVEEYSKLFIAAHAVVKPIDDCADFASLDPGTSVAGLGAVNPVLNIQSGYDSGTPVVAKDGEDPALYGSDDTVGDGTGRANGCLGAGFGDTWAKDNNKPHEYEFTLAEGVTLSEFSLRMLDFGDLNRDHGAKYHKGKMVAYDADDNHVDEHVLEYWSDGGINPNKWSWENPNDGGDLTGNLQDAGDACNATKMQPGNWVWNVEGEEIKKVKLWFESGHDPNIAFTDLCFTANDETAWPCEPQSNVAPFNEDGGNWATYIEYETSLFDC